MQLHVIYMAPQLHGATIAWRHIGHKPDLRPRKRLSTNFFLEPTERVSWMSAGRRPTRPAPFHATVFEPWQRGAPEAGLLQCRFTDGLPVAPAGCGGRRRPCRHRQRDGVDHGPAGPRHSSVTRVALLIEPLRRRLFGLQRPQYVGYRPIDEIDRWRPQPSPTRSCQDISNTTQVEIRVSTGAM